MLTLTAASKETKIILKWLAIIFIILILLFLLFKALLFVKDALFPEPPPKPTVLFDKLILPDFPENATNNKLIYTVDTLSGELPDFPISVNVNKIISPKPDLLGLKKAGEKVKLGGFTNGPTKITDTIYDWSTSNGLKKIIRVNIVNYNFNLSSNPFNDPNINLQLNFSSPNEAIDLAKDFLSTMNYVNDGIDIDNPSAKLYYYENNNTFKEATSISNAQIIQINFFQKDIDDLPIFYKNPYQSNINVLISGGQGRPQVIGANYIYHNISDESSTYPIKTAEEAFEELKNGNAYIASYFGNDNNIVINKVYLGYYLSDDEKQQYTVPIVIFEGKNGFFAYVRAIKDEWIER